MKIYQLKVSIIGIPKLYRVIEATANATFESLHEAIFEAFARYDPHLYSFFITKEDTQSIQTILNAPEITHPQNVEDFMGAGPPKASAADTALQAAELAAKDVFHYLFDFGDEWWHRIRVAAILDSRTRIKYVKLIDSQGIAPRQYPAYDDDDFED